MAGPRFILHEVFCEALAQVAAEHQCPETIYSEMSRLVVTWLASTRPDQLQTLYNHYGWKRQANVRAFHRAAQWWEQQHLEICAGSNFVDQEVFDAVLAHVPTVDDGEYQSPTTVYGDMSRLVVAWLACTPSEQLQSPHREMIHQAARNWLERYNPGRCPMVAEAV